MYDLVCIGNPVYDMIETPYVKTRDRVLSGCSVNAAITARKLGLTKVALLGCIGRDFKPKLLTNLAKLGLNIENACLKDSKETGGFKLKYTSDLRNRTLEVIGVAGRIEASDVPMDLLSSKFILIGPILQEVGLDLVKEVKKVSSAEVFLDPQGLVRKFDKEGRVEHVCDEDFLREIVKLCSYVKPNEVEARVMTGMDAEEAAKTLVKWGAQVAIVTMAERGSILCKEGKLYRIPAFETKAIDPTGAGDVYAGAFIYSKLNGRSLVEASFFASAAASIKVEHVGPDFPLTREEAERRFLKLYGPFIPA